MSELTSRIFNKIDAMNDSISLIRADVSALNERTSGLRAMGEDVSSLKTAVEQIGEPIGKNTAETLITMNIEKHKASMHSGSRLAVAGIYGRAKIIVGVLVFLGVLVTAYFVQ